MEETLFQKVIARKIPAKIAYEDDRYIAIHDISPQAPVHVLVIPKDHHPDVVALARADPAAAAGVLAAAAAVAEQEGLVGDGFRVLFNTGGYAGQEVFHVHAHVLGGTPLGPMVALP
jgi:histidine triad (HIT) family protein